MSFEIYFVPDPPQGSPAAEIQFNGQRLCFVRFSDASDAQIEFDAGAHETGASVAFPLGEFQTAVQLAVEHLEDWLRYLATHRAAGDRMRHPDAVVRTLRAC